MAFWSNIQASRVSRGINWKNLWIPNYKWIYISYAVHDFFFSKYMKLKFYGDDKINKTYMYYYDFFLYKTFDQTFLFLKKYNIDFSRLAQAGYIGKMNALFDWLSQVINTNFYLMSGSAPEFVDFYFQPQAYYFYFLGRHMNFDYTLYDANNEALNQLNIDQKPLLRGLSSSFFLTKFVFSTKTNFFPIDNFDEIDSFFYNYESKYISNVDKIYIKQKYIYQDKFRLANFLLNPNILMKYPNFIFFYNNWLHKSWQLAKKKIIQSLKLVWYGYDHMTPIITGIDYFFARYVRFFFVMREINVFFQGQNAGVGITHEFLAQQVATLMLKIWIRETMFLWIKEIWFYLKAYLKYFSFEGKVNVNRSKLIFKWLFSFWKLIQITAAGIQFSLPALISFVKIFFFTFIKSKFLTSAFLIFFFKPIFLIKWYNFLCWVVLRSIWTLKIILNLRCLSFFQKFSIFGNLISDFFINSSKIHVQEYYFSIFSKKDYSFSMNLTLNGIIILMLATFKLKFDWNKEKKILRAFCYAKEFFLNKLVIKINKKDDNFFTFFYSSYNDIRSNTKYSDWLALLTFWSPTILNFLKFSLFWKIEWKKKFVYFHFLLSQLTPKVFFRLYTDLASLTHFSILLHFAIIYWQNFFFFYFFILKCLKRMYALCSRENLLFLSQPISMFMQRSRTDTTLLDLFSSSFQKFLTLGLYCLQKNLILGNKRTTFSLSDFAFTISNFGKPNCWRYTTGNMYVYSGRFSYSAIHTFSPFFVPFISILYASKVFYSKNGLILHDKKNRLNMQFPFFETWIPTHFVIKHYSNLALSATLIAVFVKKKLEWEHLLAEVLRSLNLLISQAETIKGFMFLLKGRFSRREWATKIWLKKGKLEQTMLWTKLDYCKLPVILKYGSASVWIWLLVNNHINDYHAII